MCQRYYNFVLIFAEEDDTFLFITSYPFRFHQALKEHSVICYSSALRLNPREEASAGESLANLFSFAIFMAQLRK